MDKPVKQIENAVIEKGYSSLSVKPVYTLSGNAVNDERFPDGAYIRTSKLLRIDFEKNEAETLNTIYKF